MGATFGVRGGGVGGIPAGPGYCILKSGYRPGLSGLPGDQCMNGAVGAATPSHLFVACGVLLVPERIRNVRCDKRVVVAGRHQL